MKRLIAYTSISHFGFIALGIFAMTSQGVSGATLYMVNHGFATGALFILAGFLIVRRGSDRIADFGGVQKVAPLLAGLFLISGLAGLSLPGLSTFVSEFLVLLGTFSRYKVAAIFATVGIILAAIYILWMYQRTMNGPVRDQVAGMTDLRPRELLAVAPLVVLLIFVGVYPKPVLDIINPAVQVTMAQVHDRSGARASRARVTRPRIPPRAEGNGTVTGVLAASTGTIRAPSIEYGQLAPMLVVFGAAVAGVLVEAFTPRSARRAVQLVLALGSLAAAFILTIVVAASSTIFDNGSPGHIAAEGAVAVDRPTLFIQGTILVLAFVSVLLIADTSNSPFAAQAAAPPGSPEEREGLAAGIMHTEIFPLTLFAVGGMLLFPASNDLLTMFVALEVLSLPLYLLCGLARRRRLLSHEAAMKYFLLGAFSSAFFLFGIAMLYGFAGSVSLSAIASEAASNTANATLLYAGIALTGLGLLFKIGAVPFQGWKPDVYQGAPTPITALMASCTVVSAFGALLRVFYVAFGNLAWDWRPALWVVDEDCRYTRAFGSALPGRHRHRRCRRTFDDLPVDPFRASDTGRCRERNRCSTHRHLRVVDRSSQLDDRDTARDPLGCADHADLVARPDVVHAVRGASTRCGADRSFPVVLDHRRGRSWTRRRSVRASQAADGLELAAETGAFRRRPVPHHLGHHDAVGAAPRRSRHDRRVAQSVARPADSACCDVAHHVRSWVHRARLIARLSAGCLHGVAGHDVHRIFPRRADRVCRSGVASADVVCRDRRIRADALRQ